ncbi:MAG: hypothetical protein ACFB0A_10120, partial [Croceivirga sp.]
VVSPDFISSRIQGLKRPWPFVQKRTKQNWHNMDALSVISLIVSLVFVAASIYLNLKLSRVYKVAKKRSE